MTRVQYKMNDIITIDNNIYCKNKQNFVCIEGQGNITEYNGSAILKGWGIFIANIDIKKSCKLYYEIKIIQSKRDIRIGWITDGKKSKEWVYHMFNT